MSDLLTTPELVREIAKEPAKRWRNWWLVTDEDGVLWDDGEYEFGDVAPSQYAWPSLEIAEQKAREADADELREYGYIATEWLGAFPEGERP